MPMSTPLPPEEYLSSLKSAGESLLQQITTAFTDQMQRALNPLAPGEASAMVQRAFEAQRQYFGLMTDLFSGTMLRQFGAAPPPVVDAPPGDKRFAGTEWSDDATLAFLKQSYLIGSRLLYDLVDSTDLDNKERERLRFFTRQYVDAMSPSNLLATNREAVQRAVETGGVSFAEGLSNMLGDIAKGRISITDEEAFEVGRNLATTPGSIVFENPIFQLIQYAPMTETVRERPLLLVPPCVNKFYILDLQPENSFVRHALDCGHTVFMVSWRNTPPDQGHLTWDDYLRDAIMQAIDVTLEIGGTEQLDALGFCVGGTMLACAVAIQRAQGEDKVASLTLLTTLLDFVNPGEIGLLVDETSVQLRENTIGKGGILPGRDLSFVFSTLRANDLIWPYVVNNYLKGTKPPAFDLLFWNADATNQPGPWYCWFLRNGYLENKIRHPGRTTGCGVPIDLGRIDMPTYVMAAKEDHIVPWTTAFQTTTLIKGPIRFVLGASGHVAGVVNPPKKKKRNLWVDGTYGKGTEAWFESATSVPGSWWSDWTDWLASRPDKMVSARAVLGTNRYQAIEPAPGRYVLEKAE